MFLFLSCVRHAGLPVWDVAERPAPSPGTWNCWFQMKKIKKAGVPSIGDIIGCSDGDVGIVLSTYLRDRAYKITNDERLVEQDLMVEVSWCSGRVLTDPWDAENFTSEQDLFWVMSQA